MKIRNIGILAQVDAGKTTITEQMLYLAGELKSIGSVDKGTSFTDSMSVERERGISVRATTISFNWNDLKINLIDTPGHKDFASEVERSLTALDGAILVISAVEGVEAQTETLWKALQNLQIPTLIFINKIDRMNSDTELVLENIVSNLTPDIIQLQNPVQEAKAEADISKICLKTIPELNPELYAEYVEKIAETDDELLEKYLEGRSIKSDELISYFQKAVTKTQLYPVLFGIAKNGIGIPELLAAVQNYLPAPKIAECSEFSASIFKIENNKKLGKLAYLKINSGELRVKDNVKNSNLNLEEQINQIFVSTVKGFKSDNILSSGDIGVVKGLSSSRIGDSLGEQVPHQVYSLGISPLTVQVSAKEEKNYTDLAHALELLNSEEPNLNFQWLRGEREFNLDVMGLIHIQILEETIRSRFEIEVEISEPSIIYKESPTIKGTGFEAYTMPKPCWAVVKFEIEPGETGSGVVYKNCVSVDKIAQKYLNEVERTIPVVMKQGILGWEVTDLKITLIDGEDHFLHSRPNNFIMATQMGLRRGLQNCKMGLLEPIMSYVIEVPEDKCGRVMSDMTRLRGEFEPPDLMNGKALIRGLVPAATTLNYQIELYSFTSGKGKFSTQFHSYQPCELKEGTTREYKGIDPLDKAKYIMKMRKLLTE